MKKNNLLLLSGQDIPLETANIFIYQPKLSEIALLGERGFHIGCDLLNFSKNILSEQDKNNLSALSDFDILLSIVNNKVDKTIQLKVQYAIMIMTLLFKRYDFQIGTKNIVLTEVENGEQHIFGKESFEELKTVLSSMFCLTKDTQQQNFNPVDSKAAEIAAILSAGRAQAAAAKKSSKQKEDDDISIFSRYVSILAVGEQKDLNELMQYTVYQLYDEFERFQLKIAQDIHIQASLAGAQDLKEVENWMCDLHSADRKSK